MLNVSNISLLLIVFLVEEKAFSENPDSGKFLLDAHCPETQIR